ncbi:MAG: hypothetical protein ACT4QF_10090 [Sporichthyaceae bacterium]
MAEIDSDNRGGEPHGGDTAMFRAFVNSAEHYEEKAGSKGPIVVALVALAIAVIAFVVIVAAG